MLCKKIRSEVHGRTVLLARVPDRHRRPFLSMCVFSIPRVFYRCPTTSVAPRLENTCRPGRKFFLFQNHYRPCVDHDAVRATPDCVHRVAVLCAVPCALSLVCDHPGVSGPCCRPCPCCATLFYCVLLGCTHPLLCSVSTVLCSVSTVLEADGW